MAGAANQVGDGGGAAGRPAQVAASASPAGTSPVGEVAGYRLLGPLGAGAEGESFEAVDLARGGNLALKIFHAAGAAAERRARTQFRRLRSAHHPGVARVLDVGRDARGRLFIVTELVEGAPLEPLPASVEVAERVARFERLATSLAEAVAFLHGRGVTHGDIAPANVKVRADGGAVLIDPAPLLEPGDDGARGTLGFAAPEALAGRLGPASDLFALGATLFLVWTGRAPFGVGLDAIRAMTGGARPPRLEDLKPGLAPGWARLFDRLMQPAVEHRLAAGVVDVARGAPPGR